VIETIVGYLAVVLLSGGRRWIDRRFDEGLDALWRRAIVELRGSGYEHEVDEFSRDPRDPYARRSLEESLQEAMWQNPAFAASLEKDAQYLDRRGGQRVIRFVVDGDPLTSRVWWVVALVVVAAVLMFSGFGLFFYALYQDSKQTGPASPGLPPNAARGFALFFAGLLVLALAGFAHQITKRRW
jgi:hypothetical protein